MVCLALVAFFFLTKGGDEVRCRSELSAFGLIARSIIMARVLKWFVVLMVAEIVEEQTVKLGE